MDLLDELCASPWADVDRRKITIPDNWRYITPKQHAADLRRIKKNSPLRKRQTEQEPTPAAAQVLALLRELCGVRPSVSVRQSDLAEQLHLSRITVIRATRELCRRKLLEITRGRRSALLFKPAPPLSIKGTAK